MSLVSSNLILGQLTIGASIMPDRPVRDQWDGLSKYGTDQTKNCYHFLFAFTNALQM